MPPKATASMRILSLGVFSAKKLHLKHGNTAIHGGKKVEISVENPVLGALRATLPPPEKISSKYIEFFYKTL